MQFDFTDDQKSLQQSVQRFLTEQCPSSVVRHVIDSEGGHSPALWQSISENGFLAAAIPEEFGGVGAGYLELCVVAEECGRALAPIPSVTSIYQAAELLMMAGSDAQKQTWLPRLASGEAIGAMALSEKPGALTARSVSASVKQGRLTGTKIPVIDGGAADIALVLANDENGALTFWLAELDQKGVSRQAVDSLDPSRKGARLTFDNVAVEAVGEPGQGLELLSRVQDRAAVLVAFEQIGGAEAALMMARDYALQRYAFGRPIGSFQAIKHLLADVYVSLELARSNAYYGAWALSTGNAELPLAAASARVSATQAYQQASATNIQTHGGMGFTWEFDCHLHYRRSNYLAVALGGQGYWESRLIELHRNHSIAGE